MCRYTASKRQDDRTRFIERLTDCMPAIRRTRRSTIATFIRHSVTTFSRGLFDGDIIIHDLSFYYLRFAIQPDRLTDGDSVTNSFEIYLANNFISSPRVICDFPLRNYDPAARLTARFADANFVGNYLTTISTRLHFLAIRYSLPIFNRSLVSYFRAFSRGCRSQPPVSRAARLSERDYFLVAIYNKPRRFLPGTRLSDCE